MHTLKDYVVLETMPDWLRQSHRDANNWGNYPHNGAVRVIRERSEAHDEVQGDPDGYAWIVRTATARECGEDDEQEQLDAHTDAEDAKGSFGP
jgi:hypothetical protein